MSVPIERDVATVWDDLQDIESHTEWMQDAVAIRFLGPQKEGVGTRFECDTRVGPLRVTDVMEITAWDPGRRMGVVHTGVVSGTGEFTLHPRAQGGTEFRWDEELRFPWWLGGRLGEVGGAVVLRWIWRRNLARLKSRIERQR